MPRLRRQDFLSEEDFQEWSNLDREPFEDTTRRARAWWAKKNPHKPKTPRKKRGFKHFDEEFDNE